MSRRIYLVGAGPGDPELITLKGKRLLEEADVVVYAGSLIPEPVLEMCGEGTVLHNSAKMTLEDIVDVINTAVTAKRKVVRLASGDPGIFGTGSELNVTLAGLGISIEIVPGISSFAAGAAAMNQEMTVPEVSQTIILSRTEGRTPMPEKESLPVLAQSQSLMILFLSATLVRKVQTELLTSYPEDTPVAVVYKASWPDQKIFRGTLSELADIMEGRKIRKTALIYVGETIRPKDERTKHTRSKLYDPAFSHGYRKATK